MITNALPKVDTTVDKNFELKELNHIIDSKKWTYLVQKQTQMNEIINPDWVQEKYNWDMAIMDEALEVLGSRNWKWWKDTEKENNVDFLNLKVELVDIFHFILSKGIEEDTASMIYMAMATGEQDQEYKDFDTNKFFKEFWDQFLMATVIHSTPIQIVAWVDAWYKTGSDFNELYKMYNAKNALNQLRIEYGYKEGTYQKDWNGLEDNARMYQILSEKELMDLDDPVQEIYKIIENYYLKKIA